MAGFGLASGRFRPAPMRWVLALFHIPLMRLAPFDFEGGPFWTVLIFSRPCMNQFRFGALAPTGLEVSHVDYRFCHNYCYFHRLRRDGHCHRVSQV
jgi:hypothetical protein